MQRMQSYVSSSTTYWPQTPSLLCTPAAERSLQWQATGAAVLEECHGGRVWFPL